MNLNNLGNFYLRSGQHQLAIKAYSRAILLAEKYLPSYPAILAMMKESRAKAWNAKNSVGTANQSQDSHEWIWLVGVGAFVICGVLGFGALQFSGSPSSSDGGGGALFGFMMLLGILWIYFIPAMNAFGRNKSNAGFIPVLNIFCGWTMLGWLLLLVWSREDDDVK